MTPRIIPASDAKAKVLKLLNSEKSERCKKVEKLTLEKVNLYIHTIKEIQHSIDECIKAACSVYKREDIVFSLNDKLNPSILHNTRFLYAQEDNLKRYNEFSELRLELEQQKFFIEQLNQSRLSLVAVSQQTLDDKCNITIPKSTYQTVIQGLQAYDKVLNEQHKLEVQCGELQKEKDKETKKLTSSLAKVKNLKKETSSLKDENAVWLAKLQDQKDDKPLSTDITYDTFVGILNLYDTHKLFHFADTDKTLANFRRLAKAKKQTYSIDEIAGCINENSSYMDIFNHPTKYCAPLQTPSKVERMISDLAFQFRNPMLVASSACIHIVTRKQA